MKFPEAIKRNVNGLPTELGSPVPSSSYAANLNLDFPPGLWGSLIYPWWFEPVPRFHTVGLISCTLEEESNRNDYLRRKGTVSAEGGFVPRCMMRMMKRARR